MDNAIAKCGVLKKKAGVLRRKESRFYLLTNQGGFFQAKGFAAEFDSLKPLPSLLGTSEVIMERSGSGDTSHVLKILPGRGQKSPPMEFEATSDDDTLSWFHVMLDVIDLVGAINGNKALAQPRPIMGGRVGAEGWYVEPTGRMALYTLNKENMWMVRDKREYDEHTVLNWIASDRACSSSRSDRAGYPTQLGAAAISGSAGEQGSGMPPDYPVNARGEPGFAPSAPAVDYPVQQQSNMSSHGGAVGGAWVAAPGTIAVPSSSVPHSLSSGSGSPAGGGSIVGGVMVSGGSSVSSAGGGGVGSGGGGGGAGMGMAFAPPPAVLPSAFPLEKGGGDGFGGGAGADCLVLRRPSACGAVANGGGGVAGGQGQREEGAGAAAATSAGTSAAAATAAAAAAESSSQGRFSRVARWRGGGGGGGGGGAERRQAEPEGQAVVRRPLELSPAMELLFSSLSTS